QVARAAGLAATAGQRGADLAGRGRPGRRGRRPGAPVPAAAGAAAAAVRPPLAAALRPPPPVPGGPGDLLPPGLLPDRLGVDGQEVPDLRSLGGAGGGTVDLAAVLDRDVPVLGPLLWRRTGRAGADLGAGGRRRRGRAAGAGPLGLCRAAGAAVPHPGRPAF